MNDLNNHDLNNDHLNNDDLTSVIRESLVGRAGRDVRADGLHGRSG